MDTPVLPQSEYQKVVGQRLRRLIDLMGITQVEAARIMGVTKHVLRNWIAGDNPVQTYPLYRLCRVKHVDFNYVFLGDWSALPAPMRAALEAELLSTLEGATAPARREPETL